MLAALGAPDRARVWAALVLAGPATPAELAAAAGVGEAAAGRALRRLARAGLAVPDDPAPGTGDAPGVGARWEAALEPLAEAGRLGSRLRVQPDPGEGAPSPQEAAVLRAYLVDGRLRSMPAVRRKRLVVLDWLSQRFEPGRTYSEEEVNRILAEHHPDHAQLRRWLVDEGLMTRRGGIYWRSGGTFEIS